MEPKKNRVCPVERAGHLDSRWRRWLQNPHKLLRPYVKAGMMVMDYGCGPGFFTLDLAKMVGVFGRVIAVDSQPGMLEKLKRKIDGTEIAGRIVLHNCTADRIGIGHKVDFVLAFYVVHELTDQEGFFRELAAIVKPGGQVLVVEPPLHVSRFAFGRTVDTARQAGFTPQPGPNVRFSKSAFLLRGQL